MIMHVISSFEEFTLIHSKIWKVPPMRFLQILTPRNDIIFSFEDNIKDKVNK
jgi:hypothetical protein